MTLTLTSILGLFFLVFLQGADLRQQLEHQKQLAHIHKRFVSNEESLVQQLDGLKRSA